MLQGYFSHFFYQEFLSFCPAADRSSWSCRVVCFDHLLPPSYPRPPTSPQTQSPVPPLPAQPYFIFKRGLKDSLWG